MVDPQPNDERITLAELREYAERALSGVPDGGDLGDTCASLIELGVCASVTSLDQAAIDRAIGKAYDAGASIEQLHETISLVSGLGVHSLMKSYPAIERLAKAQGHQSSGDLNEWQKTLWDQHVGSDPFWNEFENEMPGFLMAMLRLSPRQFVAFFEYCSVPWQGKTVRGRWKELIALATDATPSHRFLPGFRLHLRNAVALGEGRRAVLQTLDIAASAPVHLGTR